MAVIADVVIIGSGALGCAAAFALTEVGMRRLVVVDRGPLISGMTRRSAGLVHTYQPHRATIQMARESLESYRHWATLIGGACGFIETGTILTATTPENVQRLEQILQAQADLGIDVRTVEPGDLARQFLSASFQGVVRCTYEPGSGYVDAVLAAQGFARRAREKGARFETGSQVKEIGQERGHITRLSTTTGDIQTPIVIITAGVGAERLILPLGVNLNLQSRRGAIGFFEQPAQLHDGHPTFVDVDTSNFIRPHAFHLSTAGIVDHTRSIKGTDGLDEVLSSAETAALAECAALRVPLLKDAPLKRGHAILYDRPLDGQPILGRVPGFEGLYIAAGFGESTIATAPAVGRAIAEILADGASKIDTEPFRPDRPTLTKPSGR
ncbi:MAG: FAD-dependent oxidoreductase [Anaerolineae bacterium]